MSRQVILVLFSLLILLIASPARAQTPIPVAGTEKLTWDQGAPDLATAQAYGYIPLVDITTVPAAPAVLAGVVCSGTATPFTCSAPLLALTPGIHTIRLVAREVVGTSTLTSAVSAPLAVLMRAIPIAPSNLRLTN